MDPLDPFTGDSPDPGEALDRTHPDSAVPLTPQEREEVLGDLSDLESFQALLGPRGVRGIVVDCADCEVEHFFSWDLLRGNLRSLLDHGRAGAHEPAYGPDPDDYVSWDYARGFADGVLDAAEE